MSGSSVDLVTVNYRGIGPALVDLLSGRVEVIFTSIASTIDLIRSGKLRSLAVTTAKRMDVLPDVPTIGEFIPGYEAAGWVGLGTPANTAPEIIAILNKQVNAALADPTFKRGDCPRRRSGRTDCPSISSILSMRASEKGPKYPVYAREREGSAQSS